MKFNCRFTYLNFIEVLIYDFKFHICSIISYCKSVDTQTWFCIMLHRHLILYMTFASAIILYLYDIKYTCHMFL